MKALVVTPHTADSLRLQDVTEPPPSADQLLVDALALGICGTDREIRAGNYGEAPSGSDFLVVGHESLGRVHTAPKGSGFRAGELVVGIVRRPDPQPCRSCAAGEWDMCENGGYTERGIKQRHGFGSQRFQLEPEFAYRVPDALGLCGVLLEPASVVAKAWEQIDRIVQRSVWKPARVLITGAGPIGLLACLMGRQRGYELQVLDRARTGPKPELVRALGATYHTEGLLRLRGHVDVIVECTGAAGLAVDALSSTAPNGVVCLAGVSSGRHIVQLKAAALNNELVLENAVIVGSVNANRRHYAAGCAALEQASPAWLNQLITRVVPFERFAEAFERSGEGDVKTVLQFAPL
ncbi:MAG TPA: glucose 1-dehydrogenase [Polyangiales bacterium]|nr:glucose 1-dehydrogenase [Polyangiales bacterium]